MFDVHPEVADALAGDRPVIAIESSFVVHSAPWPLNSQRGRRLTAHARATGVTPAVCAIVEGKIKVGLGDDELDALCAMGRDVMKAGMRDLPLLLSTRQSAALTISGTINVAECAGISVVATGGLGGVHVGAQQTMDISPDLWALATQRVAVVCAGIKSILDVRLTREHLETHAVPIIGYGTDTLPGFLSPETAFRTDARCDTPEEAAAFIRNRFLLGSGGIVLACPVPDGFGIPKDVLDAAIQEALAAATMERIQGPQSTAFLLSHIKASIGAEEVGAAIEQLSLNNVDVASQVATGYMNLLSHEA